jgi:hydrogenase maturation protease
MAEATTPLLILGLGNAILGDDGIGPVAVAQLARDYIIPDDVLVLDGGTLGLSLAPHLADARAAILVDAVAIDGAPPGSPVRLTGDEVRGAAERQLSAHQVGVADLLDGLRLRGELPELVLVGLVPQKIELRVGLSPDVEAALHLLLACIVVEARRLGFELVPRHHEGLMRRERYGDEGQGGREGGDAASLLRL